MSYVTLQTVWYHCYKYNTTDLRGLPEEHGPKAKLSNQAAEKLPAFIFPKFVQHGAGCLQHEASSPVH